MTSLITLTIPNDDHIALRAFGKALEEMALAHGAEPVQLQTYCNVTMNDELNDQLRQKLKNMLGEPRDGDIDVTRAMVEQCAPEVDTTAQQVESLVPGNEYVPTVKPEPEITFTDAQGEQVVPTTDSASTPWDERIHSTSKALNADGTWRLRRKPKDMDEADWAAFVETVKGELSYAIESFDEQVIMEEDSQQRALYTPENYVHMYRAADNIYALAKSDVELAEFEADGYVRHTQEQYDVWEGVGDDFHTDAGVVTEQTVAGIPPLPVPPPTNDWKSEVTHPENGDLCSVCMKPQFSSPSGVTCENGHGGAPAYEKPVPPPVVVPPAPVDDTWTFPKLMTFLTERQGKIDVPTVNMLLAQDGIASLPELNAHPDKIGPFVARVKAHLGE